MKKEKKKKYRKKNSLKVEREQKMAKRSGHSSPNKKGTLKFQPNKMQWC